VDSPLEGAGFEPSVPHLEHRPHPEQGFPACLGVVRLK